jgi:hypothetical protein
MRTSAEWLAYFRGNADHHPPEPSAAIAAMPARVRGPLAASIGRFYLGETGEGRIAHEALRAGDPALDVAMCEALALYIREEGRHAKALRGLVLALGGPLPKRHYTEVLFRHARRVLGLRTKMMTLAAAEVVGRAYYGLLVDHVAEIAPVMSAIASDEDAHLAFQAEYFARVVTGGSTGVELRAIVVAAGFTLITGAAIAMVLIDHAPAVDAIGATKRGLVFRCVAEAFRGAMECRERVAKAGEKTPAGVTESRGRNQTDPEVTTIEHHSSNIAFGAPRFLLDVQEIFQGAREGLLDVQKPLTDPQRGLPDV